MRHPVVLSLAALCFLLLPEFVLAEEVVAPQAGETRQPRAFTPQRPPRFDVEAFTADYKAEFEAVDRANKKRLTVPLSADGITHVRVRRASGSGGESYGSCTGTHTGLSGNLAASDIASAIVSGLERLCNAVNNVAGNVSEFRSGYNLVLSLKKPLMGVSTLRWQAATLDDAMNIIRSVQEGRLEAAIVRTHDVKKKPEPDSKPIKYELEPCQECPIMEWVFRVSVKK